MTQTTTSQTSQRVLWVLLLVLGSVVVLPVYWHQRIWRDAPAAAAAAA